MHLDEMSENRKRIPFADGVYRKQLLFSQEYFQEHAQFGYDNVVTAAFNTMIVTLIYCHLGAIRPDSRLIHTSKKLQLS